MYNLYYWDYSPCLMCTFEKYEDAKKALKQLNKLYPGSKIWIEPVETVKSFEEWKDKYNSGNDIYN